MERPHLLFVCVENANRSQMAEGFAREIGGRRVAAFSAGSRPAAQVNPRAAMFMREKAVDISGQRPKGLDALPQITWDWIVMLGCGDACPNLPARHRLDWDLPDPRDLDDAGFRAVRDRLESLVSTLIEQITRPTPAGS